MQVTGRTAYEATGARKGAFEYGITAELYHTDAAILHHIHLRSSHSGRYPNGARVRDFEISPALQTPAAVRPPFDDDADEREDEPLEEPPARPREGLPAAYRMRHAPHYVEQLMGSAPIQTVRQVAVDQIDAMDHDAIAGDISQLAASIGQVGVLQPLLVTPAAGGRFALVAGARRLLAARSAGLGTAPCVVVQADEARAAELRRQAAVTSTAHQPEPVAPLGPAITAGGSPVQTPWTEALDDISGALEFVSALLPAASVARSAFQRAMIADVIRVEKRRAAALKSAAFFLGDAAPMRPEEFEWVAFTEELRADVALEARLRGVEIEWLHSLKPRRALADRNAMMTGWTAILHAVLGVSQAGDRIAVALATPRSRPSVVFTVVLHPEAHAGEEDAVHTFGGDPVEMMLPCARQSAERQGGSLTVTTAARSLTIEFVAPQPPASAE